MASRELHVVTLRVLIMILSADMTMVQHLPMQVLRKVFPLVIREPCVPQQTSSERSYLAKYSPSLVRYFIEMPPQTRNKGTTWRHHSGCDQRGECRNLGRSSGKSFVRSEIGKHLVVSPSKSSLWRKSHRKPKAGKHKTGKHIKSKDIEDIGIYLAHFASPIFIC